MDAVFKIKASEFNEDLFAKIKSLIKGRREAEITIVIREEELSLVKETPEQYVARIKKSADEIEIGKGITFTMEELEDFTRE